MKFLRISETPADEGSLLFEIGRREKLLLTATLRHYPLLDSSYHRLSKNDPAEAAAQQLLEEAMAEQRLEHGKKVDEFLSRTRDLAEISPETFLIKLSPEQVEWLLQVLNDVRVGSWVLLGRPEPDQTDHLEVAPENVRFLSLMQLSGYFEASLLEAFR